MPLHEAKSKNSRESFPLAFDLEGVPRERATRELLMQQERQKQNEDHSMNSPENHFAVDQMQEFDPNKPPQRPYNPHDPKNQFPRIVYHHDTGHVLQVEDEKQLKAATKRAYKLTPAPDRDYSKITSSGIAAKISAADVREEQQLSAADLAAIDEAENTNDE
jgi:hypothetical protein